MQRTIRTRWLLAGAVALAAACQDPSQPTSPPAAARPAAARTATGAAVAAASCPYSLATLQAWFEDASPAVLSKDGGVYADVNEVTTCLDFGVLDAATQAAAADTLSDLGIPSNAYTIEITPAITEMRTLRERTRPTVGGIQIEFGPNAATAAGICTLGYNVAQGTRREFITNDHCTDVRGAVTGSVYYQPNRGVAGASVGVEIVDPPFFTRGLFVNRRCPANRRCRYSDAARIQYNAATASTVGRVARPDGVNNGSLTVDPANPEFSMVATAAGTNFTIGTTLNKVGRTTGWSQGPVTRTCADVNVAGGVTRLCQTQVRANVGGGDSGSPVFSIADAAGNGTLYGILFAGGPDAAGVVHFWFSPISSVFSELGI
jgi:hypothetical protein